MSLLSLLLWTPLAGALLVLLLPGRAARVIQFVALGCALLPLVPLALLARLGQAQESTPWMPAIGSSYALGIDGVSLLLSLLTVVLPACGMLASWNEVRSGHKQFYALLLALQTTVLGVFLSLDFVLFYVFWELSLIPVYFLITLWGGPRRLHAGLKFLLYTIGGSLPLLAGGLVVFQAHLAQTGVASFALADLLRTSLSPSQETLVFWLLLIGFAVKVPMVPFHTWLPDAHVEAPTAASMMLAGVMLKMGVYGMLRYGLPLAPHVATQPGPSMTVAALSLVAILYAALISFVQRDWKRLIAYSSISHLGFCTLGLISLTPNGVAGSVLQQFNHGITSGLLFLMVGLIYQRRHSRSLDDYGGLSTVMPHFSRIMTVAAFSSAGLPLLNGFAGEFTILRGVFELNPWWAAIALPGVLIAAAYMLFLIQQTLFGPPKDDGREMQDLSVREWLAAIPLLAFIFWVGLAPQPFLNLVAPPAQSLVQRMRPLYFAAPQVAPKVARR